MIQTEQPRWKALLKSAGPACAAGWLHLRLAASLMTRIPVPAPWPADLKWGLLAGWFPAVGAVLGLVLALAAIGWMHLTNPFPMVAGALVLALWVGLTGGLHLDGWCDCADAFLAPVSRERRLAIMADPHMGAFGATWLFLLLLVKWCAVCEVITRMMGEIGFWWELRALWPLVVAAVAGRAVLVALLAYPGLPLARPDGMGARAREGLGWGQAAAAGATALVVALLGGWVGLGMLLAAAAAGGAMAWAAKNRIGGLSGDVLGATVEAAETLALVASGIRF